MKKYYSILFFALSIISCGNIATQPTKNGNIVIQSVTQSTKNQPRLVKLWETEPILNDLESAIY